MPKKNTKESAVGKEGKYDAEQASAARRSSTRTTPLKKRQRENKAGVARRAGA